MGDSGSFAILKKTEGEVEVEVEVKVEIEA